MSKKKKADAKVIDWLIAESIWHCQLDALGCPPGRYIGKRLSDWCKERGIDPFEKRIRCATCGTHYRKGSMCPKCFSTP